MIREYRQPSTEDKRELTDSRARKCQSPTTYREETEDCVFPAEPKRHRRVERRMILSLAPQGAVHFTFVVAGFEILPFVSDSFTADEGDRNLGQSAIAEVDPHGD